SAAFTQTPAAAQRISLQTLNTESTEREMNCLTAPTAPNSGFCRSARPRQGFAPSARRSAALTRPARFARKASIGAVGILNERKQPMLDRSLTPSITVTIGQHTRLYFAFITTAPADLDSPATITLHAGDLSEVSGFAAEPLTLDPARGGRAARLVLVDAMELAWQRAKYRGHQHLLLAGDPVLVGLNTLQHWLWQRLQSSGSAQVAAWRSFHSTRRQPLATASFSGGHIMVVKITPNDKGNPPGKLADAELHFTDGALEGLKLIGFSIWERRGSRGGRNVTFPARQYVLNG